MNLFLPKTFKPKWKKPLREPEFNIQLPDRPPQHLFDEVQDIIRTLSPATCNHVIVSNGPRAVSYILKTLEGIQVGKIPMPLPARGLRLSLGASIKDDGE